MLRRGIGIHGIQGLNMFGIIGCSECGRKRIIDLSSESTKCPYCGNSVKTRLAAVIFKDPDQSVVRAAFDSYTGFVMPEKVKGEDKDPMSTLAYKVEHTSDVNKKMVLIAEELTRIKGTFTQEDVEELVPGKGEQYLKLMLTTCTAYEVGYGKYKV